MALGEEVDEDDERRAWIVTFDDFLLLPLLLRVVTGSSVASEAFAWRRC